MARKDVDVAGEPHSAGWCTTPELVLAIPGIAAHVVGRLDLRSHWISDTTTSIALSMVIVVTLIRIDTRRTRRTVCTVFESISAQRSQPQQDGT